GAAGALVRARAGRLPGRNAQRRRAAQRAASGAAMIAALSGAPVVPAYIDGARESMPVGGRFPAPARVHVRFGRPLRFEAGGRRDRDALQAFAQAMLDAIRRLEPAA